MILPPIPAAREFKIHAKRIRDWYKQKELLKKMKKTRGRKRLAGGGRKMLDEGMEKAVFDWIGEMRASNLRVSRRMIKAKAKDTSTEEGFKASNGWLQRFMRRNGLSLWRKNTVCQCPPADSIPKLVSFITYLQRLQKKHKYQPLLWMKQRVGWTCHLTPPSMPLELVQYLYRQQGMRRWFYSDPYCSSRWD